MNKRRGIFLDYQYGIRLVRKPDVNQTNLITFNARNEHDRTKFCDDLKEAIMEMDEMEGLRVQSELEKLRGSWTSLIDAPNNNNNTINSSSGSNTNGIISSLIDYPTNKRDRPLSRTLSNSLLDMTLAMNVPSTTVNHTVEFLPSRNSQCSVDSGMVMKYSFFHPCYDSDQILFTTKKCPFELILWLLLGCGQDGLHFFSPFLSISSSSMTLTFFSLSGFFNQRILAQ